MTEIQKRALYILEIVIKICEERGLQYYAFGGTCLGAVRHNGFIPWDDDIDIAMPRSDYSRFLEYAKTDLPDYIGIIEQSRTEHHFSEYLKVYDSRTAFIETSAYPYPDRYCGIGIDIMPLDGVPKGKLKRFLRYRYLRLLARMNYCVRCDIKYHGVKGRFINLLVAIHRPFIKWDYFYKKYIKAAAKYSFETSELVAHSGPGVLGSGKYKYYLDRKCFSDWILMDFEDIQLRVPKDYDTYLRKYYPERDYMEIPPHDEQIVHDTVIVDLERPYTYYVEKYRKGDFDI